MAKERAAKESHDLRCLICFGEEGDPTSPRGLRRAQPSPEATADTAGGNTHLEHLDDFICKSAACQQKMLCGECRKNMLGLFSEWLDQEPRKIENAPKCPACNRPMAAAEGYGGLQAFVRWTTAGTAGPLSL